MRERIVERWRAWCVAQLALRGQAHICLEFVQGELTTNLGPWGRA